LFSIKELDKIVEATHREKRKLQGADKIGVRVGRNINKFKVAKLFEIDLSENSFDYRRKQEAIAAEEALDGVYIIRTPVAEDVLNTVETVRAYKGLSKVEQAFRCLKTIDLKVRPIYHYLDNRVKAHIFLCFLAYYVEWHMREALAPILFEEVDNDLMNSSNLLQDQPSSEVRKKTVSTRTSEGLPVHSFSTLLSDGCDNQLE
jgi:transposase